MLSFTKIPSIFKCPHTDKPLFLDNKTSSLTSKDASVRYFIENGIINFLTDKKERILSSYDDSVSLYDRFYSTENVLSNLSKNVLWGFSDQSLFVNPLLQYISPHFSGIMVDIPVGTGFFTAKKYAEMNNKYTIVIDCSMEMLLIAQQNYSKLNISNIIYVRADVSNIPIINSSIDLIISMNGYHAFINKSKSLSELLRILKPHNSFCGCFYVKGKRLLSDLFVSFMRLKKGWFTPPHFNEHEILEDFGRYCNFIDYNNINSMFYFNSIKK